MATSRKTTSSRPARAGVAGPPGSTRRSSEQGSRDLVTRAFAVFALVALSGCVDKTPPPLWPTPPPPTLAQPIGVAARAGQGDGGGPGGAVAPAVPPASESPDVAPDGLGPWQPTPAR